MDRPRRDSRQHNGITLRGLSQLTFATKSAMSGSTGTLFDNLVSTRVSARSPKALVTLRRTPTTAGSRSASAPGSRCLLASSHLGFIDGRGPLMGRELLRQMVRSQPFLCITMGEPCNIEFEKRSELTVSL